VIPVRLVLKDFLSYGEPDPVDFTGFDVACLTGDNGVGKSAFLDAISWALFGAARGCENGQNQDRLIREGAAETLVDFSFTLGDQTYRIVRRRSKTKGDVRFMIADGDDWTNTVRETEDRIRSTLRLDYDTFTASAFFVQGHAEDFLRMRPERRKEVFASLLDLGIYEKLEEGARARGRDAERRRVDAAELIERLSSTGEDAAWVRAELDTARVRAGSLRERAASAENDAAKARAVVSELVALEATADGERRLIASLEANLRRDGEVLAAKHAELRALDALVAKADELRDAHRELQALIEKDEALRAKEREAGALREREAELRTAIKAANDAAIERVDDARREVAHLNEERALLERAETELAKASADLADLVEVPAALEGARKSLETARADEARIMEAIRNIDVRVSELAEHSAILARGGGECPVCGSALDARNREQAAARLRADLRSLEKERTELSGEADVARKEAKRCGEEVARLTKADVDRERVAALIETLRARLERLPVVRAEIERLSSEIETLAERIAKGTVAPGLEAELATVARDRAALYDGSAHAEVTKRIGELRPAEELWMRATHASEQRTTIEREIGVAEAHIAAIEREIAERRAVLTDLEGQLERFPAARESLRAKEEAVRLAADDLRAIEVERARLEERLAAAERKETELAAARAAELTAATESRRYGRLVQAFGRNGIPALVMDNVLPDLREEANDLLGELSNWDMSVDFDLKRPTKAGKERDTFDVRVRTTRGEPRDFAMFSGGEAFRIAFAVRLAMSKLLVRRAGARLETLVIDEGFGSQDPEGRERLVAAINLARREFRKVLVITHLDELKDAFPTQIRVTKDEGRGSVLQIERE
jgi:exonuclease SbcC